MRKLYIGISGKMGSGKSTLTKEIIKAVGESFKTQTVSLAAPIKRVQHLIYKDLDLEMVGEKDRPLLIALGMWGRDRDSDFWLKQAVKDMESSEAQVIICDDVRFENEAEWFDAHGILIRINGVQRGENVDPSRADDATETSLDDYKFKYTVSNTETKELMVTSALYAISKHIGADNLLLDNLAQEASKKEA